MKHTLLFSLILSISFAFGGNEPQPLGARRAGMGGAFTAVRGDIWAMAANPAGLSDLKNMQVGLYLERRFMLKEINSGAFAFGMPFQEKHFAGLDFNSFGFGAYNESRLGLAYATTIIPKISFGAKFNVVHTSIQEYGAITRFVLDAGISSQITKSLSLGFSIFNASQTYLRKDIFEKVPTTLNLGLAWRVSNKVLALADFSKNEQYPFSFKGGLEYRPMDILYIRAGMSTKPVNLSMGLGLNWKNANFDFAATYHEQLGLSPHFGLSYSFGKEKK